MSEYKPELIELDYHYCDGGREAAGYKGNKVGDCVTRAATILSGRPYREVYNLMAQANKPYSGARSARNGIYKQAYVKVFKELNIVKVKLPAGPKPTWYEAYMNYGDCIVTTTRHLAAITKGALRDTYDRRYYEWDDGFGGFETRERKASGVWVMGVTA